MSLGGRVQTRILLVLLVGVPWTGIFVLLAAPSQGFAGPAKATSVALLSAVLLGCLVWEPIYHLLQQRRWDRDWPMLLGLVTGIPEGAAVALVLHLADLLSAGAFIIHFTIMWVLVWLTANGPLRVLLPRWRYRGGRVL